MIIDYSVARPSVQTLRSAGVTAVGRYIGWDSVAGYSSIGKNLSAPESKALLAAGISIFLSFEYAPDAAAHGTSQGTSDGQLAKAQLAELDAPPSMAVYFAVDYDMPDYAPSLADTPANAMAKLGPVGQYFKAINNLKYPYEVGVYGGYWTVKRVMDAKLATKAWQTIAWSGGLLDHRAVLYQNNAPAPIGGSDTDVRENAVTDPDFGQWPRPASVVKPPSGQYAVPVVTVSVHPISVTFNLTDTKSPHYRVMVAADSGGKPGAIIPGGSVVVYTNSATIPVPGPGTYWVQAQSAGNSPFSTFKKFTV
jgi:hypothetical protein